MFFVQNIVSSVHRSDIWVDLIFLVVHFFTVACLALPLVFDQGEPLGFVLGFQGFDE